MQDPRGSGGDAWAIDSQNVYAFDYETGTGTQIGKGGNWGIHALDGPLTDCETGFISVV